MKWQCSQYAISLTFLVKSSLVVVLKGRKDVNVNRFERKRRRNLLLHLSIPRLCYALLINNGFVGDYELRFHVFSGCCRFKEYIKNMTDIV